MANVKISNFTPQSDLSLIDGLAGYQGANNVKITGAQVRTSIIPINLNSGTTPIEVSGVLSVSNGGTGIGSLDDGRILIGDGTNAIATLDARGKGKLVVGRTVGVTDSTGVIPVGTNGQVLIANSSVTEYGVEWADKDADKAFVALTGSTPTWTIKDNYNATWTPPAGAVTLAITAAAGDSGAIIINSVNAPTITYPATSQFTGGTPPTLSGGTDILSFLYDGTNYYWNYGLDFQP